MDQFRVRLNCIDHYQASPTRYDPQLRNDVRPSQASKGPKVPVVRIFGSTETGQKVCAHVHGAFPYLYVEYRGGLSPEEVGTFIYRLHLSIDHALAVSYRRDQQGSNAKFVARITLVKGIPFYGYYVGYRFFLKIYMFNPIVMTRLADLLQQGVIIKQQFQPFEAHLQYLLQFMVDYNLYGCDYLEASKTNFRSPVPPKNQGSNSLHLWHDLSIPAEVTTDDESLPRASHCSIEVDICVQNITNRKMVEERRLHHDFVERLSPICADVKLVHSMAGLWRDETKRRQRQLPLPEQGKSPFPPEVLVSMSADSRDSHPQGWIHEEEYLNEVRQLIDQERAEVGDKKIKFDSFAKVVDLEDTVNTALQSVEDLYPSKLMPVLGLSSNPSQSPFGVSSSVEVDETLARQAPLTQDDYLSDEAELGMFDELLDDEGLNETAKRQGDLAGQLNPAGAGKGTLGIPRDPRYCLAVPGVGLSVLKTAQFQKMPMFAALLEAAEDEGLVGRVKQDEELTSSMPNQLKRRTSSDFSPSSNWKRSKRESPSPEKGLSSQKGVNVVRYRHYGRPGGPATGLGVRREAKEDQIRGRSKPSARSVTLNETLSFPIVKDDVDAKMKLQMRDKTQLLPGQRSSQASQKRSTPSKKPKLASSLPPMPNLMSSGQRIWPTQASRLTQTSAGFSKRHSLVYAPAPPSIAECNKMKEWGLPDVVHQDAYYSEEKDVPERSREYAGREYRLESQTVPFLPYFDAAGSSRAAASHAKKEAIVKRVELGQEQEWQRYECSWRSWELAQPPPSRQSVTEWHKQERAASRAQVKESRGRTAASAGWLSQICGPTPKTKHGFKYTQKRKSTSVEHEVQYMSTMSLEVHVNTRGKFVPNPEADEIQCVFWACKTDDKSLNTQEAATSLESGMIALSGDDSTMRRMPRCTQAEAMQEKSELDVLMRVIDLVRKFDPDILTGYEVHNGSWGFLIERARCKYDWNLCDELSRMKSDSHGRFDKNSDRWGFNTTSTIRITGRHMINIWRAMQSELKLVQYTLENVAWHLVHVRVPHYPWKTLTQWHQSGKTRELSKLLRYYRTRTRLDLRILEANELIARTSEQARLLGVDFFSVFSRGSQFKVEFIMFRIAKPENFVLVSPSKRQVGGQNALECLPLVMEPQSDFYSSPVVVLDFQSLYLSVMIAYNYCYSTMLGRIRGWRGVDKLGFTEYSRQQGLLLLLQEHINIAPNGIMYAKAEIRKSLLAKMLTEILETRVMVKSGMKRDKGDKTLQQLLNNRQLALKLLANVTYGYTSASFSGRMPCAEIADSIVQTGRETLERAVAYIHAEEARWGAEVVYGDTDSLFVHLPGRTRAQAFAAGEEMARAITAMNPRPVKLKFEKVYHPCLLLAKKRYVGYKWESREQAAPEMDAKGIETVRRDGTPAEQKMEDKALRLLFDTADLSAVKAYFQEQCFKVLRGAVSVQDFCFAREVRLGSYAAEQRQGGIAGTGAPPPPGALVSARRMADDARAEPQYGERVPYVVIAGAPGARLADRCVAPEELLANPHWQLDAEYYIVKNLIPPLECIFNLVGANVRQWYDEMPKVLRVHHQHQGGDADATTTNNTNTTNHNTTATTPITNGVQSGGVDTGNNNITHRRHRRPPTLESYLRSTHCIVCGTRFLSDAAAAASSTSTSISTSISAEPCCPLCRADANRSLLTLQTRLAAEQRRLADLIAVCRSCAGLTASDFPPHPHPRPHPLPQPRPHHDDDENDENDDKDDHAVGGDADQGAIAAVPIADFPCDSKDCPVFWSRARQRARLVAATAEAGPAVRRLVADADRLAAATAAPAAPAASAAGANAPYAGSESDADASALDW